jgi:hypothetical protein
MRRYLCAVGLLLTPWVGFGTAVGLAAEKGEAATCGSYGTTVDFVDSPKAAAQQAAKEGKLVLVLHVSGNFEDPRFT